MLMPCKCTKSGTISTLQGAGNCVIFGATAILSHRRLGLISRDLINPRIGLLAISDKAPMLFPNVDKKLLLLNITNIISHNESIVDH